MKPGLLDFLFSAKHLVFLLLAAAGVILLLRRKVSKLSRLAVLAASFLLLGSVLGLVIPLLARPLGLHPSPMCGLTKLMAFGWLKGRFPLPLVVGLAVILVLSLLARKSFCGWVCPLGSAQELLYMIPGVKKLRNLPFIVSNSVRAVLFLVFLVGLFGFGVITYDHFNAFETLHWRLSVSAALVGVPVLIASLVYYRPYCYVVCPLGLVTWLVEPAALLRVRVDRERCDDCRECVDASPCPAMEGIVSGSSRWTADCTSCGLCLSSCPKEALSFGPGGFRKSS